MFGKITLNEFVIFVTLALTLVIGTTACGTEVISPSPVPTSTPLPPTLTPPPPSPTELPILIPAPAESKYGFEDELNGWIPQTYENATACIEVLQSEEKAKDGEYSLKLNMDLIGGDELKSQGEAWVDMRIFPPLDEIIPDKSIDLTNRTVTMWVYALPGSLGDQNKPNGFQVFVKDASWNGSYSAWTNIIEDQWIQLSFTITASVVETGYMDQGFDPSQIVAVGLKVGSGEGSTAVFQGSIYLDAVDW